MSGLMDMLTGIHRYFPNTMIVGLIVLGLALVRVSWVLVGIGGIIMAIILIAIELALPVIPFFGDKVKTTQTPGLMEACSISPISSGGSYEMIPSYWFGITAYFLSYIISNAVSVYTKNPTKQPNTAIAVQQRKGLGVISILAVSMIGLILLFGRFISPCESWIGMIMGLLLGAGWGYLWWFILNKQGNDIFQDIHNVMIGLQPGDLRTGPVACKPSA
jgi:hypothetical protein